MYTMYVYVLKISWNHEIFYFEKKIRHNHTRNMRRLKTIFKVNAYLNFCNVYVYKYIGNLKLKIKKYLPSNNL